MKVLRGDIDNPKGSVLIYSELEVLVRKKEENLSVGIYATNNSDKLIKRFPGSEEVVAQMLQDSKEEAESKNTVLNIFSQMQNRKIEVRDIHFFSIEMGNPSIEELIDDGEDLIFGGKFVNPENIQESLRLINNLYVHKYLDNLERQEIMRRLNRREAKLKGIPKKREYSEFIEPEKIDIKEYIITRYVNPLLQARRKKDILGMTEIKSEFNDFSYGTGFFKLTGELCGLLSQTELPNTKLVDSYVTLISAIHLENYEEAEQQKRKIKELKN